MAVEVMHIYPDFVPAFCCQLCGTCCRNDWQVTLDKTSYERNRLWFSVSNNPQEFQAAFSRVESQGLGEYAAINKKQGACWFLEEDNRCQLHRLAGHEHLDSVCRTYPRYPMATARGWEITLTFSCPAVLELVSKVEPIQLVRSGQAPLEFDQASSAAQVFPSQQPANSNLRYYFELEQHSIDILQWRAGSIPGRLELLAAFFGELQRMEQRENFGAELNQLLNRNYDYMDNQTTAIGCPPETKVTADILIEHFFVNLVFKKVGYLYGLPRLLQLLTLMWQKIAVAQETGHQSEAIRNTKLAIMELELAYSHNRKDIMPL